ncbi:hypothetical protein ABIF65_001936 [Bradyrhizobium japonicum]|jgi:hypothetical protein|uniref:hypothetical protein n=1 Tax=Bradyrhizobium liaoningense TaxID=43992 RepID=UPI000414B9ED|nr:hypothetical protein [Bradyrhizobium liaoningense]MCP1740427.1 hypothetical protein [Bradyrhizobium japonicum]MBR0881588.1 hypothetical protein [Bradyrhizobium liaoningense]MCP1778668.1 hypothetical protein [Bradyrhizobium japonicum]MCP1858104.1 hypothetical protein [Bradyrhizobium japonicum]MCP1888917.1 hypothetical protein [Bradyrhizobium japonicum]
MPDVMPIVAASVALFILLWFASIALYAMPESDDYCVTNASTAWVSSEWSNPIICTGWAD